MNDEYQYQEERKLFHEREEVEAASSGANDAVSKSQCSDVIVCLAIYKIIFFFFVICSIELLPIFSESAFESHKSYPLEGEATLASHFGTWDSAHYLYLAESGYEAGDPSCAFYPLLPFLIYLGSFVTFGHPVVAGLIITNIASFLGLYWLYRLVAAYQDHETAVKALILMLAFPGAFFINLIYTEGIFLLLIVLFFWFLFREQYAKSAVAGFFLPLTKAIGVFAVLPLAWQLWRNKASWRSWASLAGPLGGYGCYFLIMGILTGNPFEGFEAQKHYPNQPSIANMFDVRGFLDALLGPLNFHGFTNSAIDRLLFFVFVGSLIVIFLRLNTAYFLYAACAGMVPALAVWFMSYNRNVMAAFPMFIALATLFKGDRPLGLTYFVGLLGVIQILFILRHINFMWAG